MVLIDWANPPPMMPIVRNHALFSYHLISRLKCRVLVVNPRYIFAVSRHTLIHGGYGHRPLLNEELVTFWTSFAYHLSYIGSMENSLNLGKFPIFSKLLQIE